MSTESWKKIHSALESYAALASHMNDEVCQSYYGEWQRALEAVDVAEEEENRIADLEAAIALQAERVMELEEALQWIEALEARATPALPQGDVMVGRLPTVNQDEYPGLGEWWVQLRIGSDGKEVLARVYGETPQQAHDRATSIASHINGLKTQALPQGVEGSDASFEQWVNAHPGYTYRDVWHGAVATAIPEGMAIVPVEGFKIEAGSEAYQEVIVTAPDGGQQIFWPEDAAHGLMKAMLAAAKEKGE